MAPLRSMEAFGVLEDVGVGSQFGYDELAGGLFDLQRREGAYLCRRMLFALPPENWTA